MDINATRTRVIDASRGMIYDRNMIPLVNNAYKEIVIIKPSVNAVKEIISADASEDIIKSLSNGFLTITTKEDAKITEATDDIKLFKITTRYGDNSLLHIIGYTDQYNEGVCGIEKHFNDYLKSSGGELSVTYTCDALGRVLTAEDIKINDNGYTDNDGIVLTIDKEIQKICENALHNSNIKKGGVIVLDVKTSEILACASTPQYDRKNLADYINSPDSPFINRCFSPYPVGSVFKVVTAAAMLEGDNKVNEYFCTGKTIQSTTIFNCNKTEGHGNIGLDDALSKSCNPYFIDMGIKTGSKRLLNTAEALGFGKATDFGNGFLSDSGLLPTEEELNSDAAIGNFAFGQGKLTATPLQIASLFAVIGRNGIQKKPQLILGYADKNSAFLNESESKKKRVLSPETCKAIKDALTKTTVDGTGKAAFSSLYNCCAKTGTAQSGQMEKNGKEILYCWFCGLLPAENPEYVICVLKENGAAGGSDCGPVFKEIGEQLTINSH